VLILAIILLGMVAGGIAWLVVRGKAGGINWPEAFVAGIAGSFVGGLLGSLLSGDGFDLRPSGVIGSTVGAIIVLAVWGWVRGRRVAA
jgi:uncharacterized membrane protein YeaQ/YmgE (transglycosylase-associated protein family)